MGNGLNPASRAHANFMAEYPKREAFSRRANYLEPPFPYKILPFNPIVYHLDRVQTPDDPPGPAPPLVESLGGEILF